MRVHVLESTLQAHLEHDNRVEILTNGDHFYPAMLDAIRTARETISMECYIFKKGAIGEQFIEALCERAKAGVRVTLVMDAIGSFGAFRKSAKPLEAAGCRVAAYQRLMWYRLSRLNNRTFRDANVSARLARDFEADLLVAKEITFDDWRGRPLWEKLIDAIAWILERQQ